MIATKVGSLEGVAKWTKLFIKVSEVSLGSDDLTAAIPTTSHLQPLRTDFKNAFDSLTRTFLVANNQDFDSENLESAWEINVSL